MLDVCYPSPPKDVFERLVGFSHYRQRLWLAYRGDSLLGMVMLSPHSKGGHLENLAVAPSAQGHGIGCKLVQSLLHSVSMERSALVSLTTRIPNFFIPLGFKVSGELGDGSTAMITLLSPSTPIKSITNDN